MRLPSYLPFGRRDVSGSSISGLENPSVDLVAALVAASDGSSSSGVSVTPIKAFRLAAVYACVRAIAEAIASLPVEISQSDAPPDGQVGEGAGGLGGRQVMRKDYRWNLLNGFPNPEMTSVELYEGWIGHALLWGKGYLYIVTNKKGEVIELWPLKPDATQEKRVPGSNELYYETTLADGTKAKLHADSVICLKSLFGMSPVMNGRETIASAAAAEQYAGRFWTNNARPGGVIELPSSMTEDEMTDFTMRWKAGHEGLKRSQLVGILTGGAKWQDVGLSPAVAQFIETRQFSVREIARMFRVPPHVIGDLEGTVSRASIEQQAIEYVSYTLRPWIVRAEQQLRFKLFNSKADLGGDVYPRFNFDDLMRGDMQSRYHSYAIGIQWGFLNRADPRRMEGKQTAPDDQKLEDFLVPLNMIPSSKLDEIDVAGKSAPGSKDPQGGTQPTDGSDGSKPQATKAGNEPSANSLVMLAGMFRDYPEVADLLDQAAAAAAKARAEAEEEEAE